MRRWGLVVSIAFGAVATALALFAPLDRWALDHGFAFLRKPAEQPPPSEVVVVGIDEETLAEFPEPIALWHTHLADFLSATAGAGARLTALDVVLPDRSYAAVRPDLDARLLGGLLAARRSGDLVLAVTVDSNGRPRPVHAPFLAAAGPDGSGFALWSPDPDGVVRRFDERLGQDGEAIPTFAGQIVRRLGVEPHESLIDFAYGTPMNYIALHDVLAWQRRGETPRLQRELGAKIVLLGSVLPFEDQHRAPLKLSTASHDATDSGVFLHAQMVRATLAGRTVERVPAWLAALLGGLAGLVWGASARPARALATMTLAVLAALGFGIAALAQGWFAPAGSVAAIAVLAGSTRVVAESVHAWRERRRLRLTLGGYVSPQVMAEIEAGRLDGLVSIRTSICVLFMDVRGFTHRSETHAPDRIVALINELCDVATRAIHAHGGTVDKFMGDGVMAFFGAPAKMANPCEAAFGAAREVLAQIAVLSETFEARGEEPFAIGIGLACGNATVGHIGSSVRHAYTAIGDCVNVASRLEGLTAELGYPLVLARDVAERVSDDGRLVPLGAHTLKGHSPVEIYGWR